MDEFLWFRLGGYTLGGIDWATAWLFIAIALVYFLAPVLGYRSDRRGALIVSLYLLIAYAGLSVTLLFLQYTKVLDEKAGRGKEDLDVHVLFLFSILKMLLFTLAMVMFVVGLQGLRQRAHADHDEE